MGKRSFALSLPKSIRKELDRRLVSNGFAEYSALAAWLSERGFPAGKSSVHRYGSRLEMSLQAKHYQSINSRSTKARPAFDRRALIIERASGHKISATDACKMLVLIDAAVSVDQVIRGLGKRR